MIDMDPTPAPIESEVDDIIINCTPEESQARLEKCKSCVNFYTDEDEHTKCKGCGCNISMMITFKFKECPLNKW